MGQVGPRSWSWVPRLHALQGRELSRALHVCFFSMGSAADPWHNENAIFRQDTVVRKPPVGVEIMCPVQDASFSKGERADRKKSLDLSENVLIGKAIQILVR